MITCIAIDDEANALGVITEYAKRIPDLELVQVYKDPAKALQDISAGKIQFDLVFLDIQMSRINGLTLAQRLPQNTNVILTTAYPDFALQGYEMDVVDYLLKPFSFARFERAVKKVRSISGGEQSTSPAQSSQLLSPEKDDFIFVKSDSRMIKVMLDSIYYLEGSGNYVTIHTTKGKVMVLQNLRKFEDQLRPYKFIRIHKSFIISLNYVDVIERATVRVHTFELPIGETYREDFHHFIDKQYRNF